MPVHRLRNIDIYHEVAGEGDPVLLLHGLGSSTRDWEYQLPALTGRYRVITADARGHGRSTRPPGPYSVPMFAADARALLGRITASPVHVVGISMGGMVGIQLALDAPDLVRSLVTVNAGPRLSFEGLRSRASLQVRLFLTRFIGMRAVGRRLAGEMFPEPGQEEFREKLMHRWAENDRRCYLESIRALLAFDASHRVTSIRCPLLTVRGELDKTPMDFTEDQLARMPRARRMVFEGSRHATVIDQWERFNGVLLEFLAGVRHSPEPASAAS